jgi:RNA polymerase sigma factor for flagellar operon FliA
MRRGSQAYAGAPDDASALIERHAVLIDRAARRLAARAGMPELADELWSAGALGLLDAARRFEPGRDIRFETFAEHRVRGAMLDELRRLDPLPRRLRARAERGEIAGLEGVTQPPVSLEALGNAAPAEEPSAEERASLAQRRDRLAAAISRLPQRWQTVLSLYYVEELTLKEIGQVLEVSEARVSQLHKEALKVLRAALGEVLGEAAP